MIIPPENISKWGVTMPGIQVSVVDPHQLSREGLRLLLPGETYDVTSATPSLGAALLEIEAGTQPALLVLVVQDAGETFQSAAESAALQRLRAVAPECKVVLIAKNSVPSSLLAQAISGGVNALLRGDMSREILTRSLHLVMLGQNIFPAFPSVQPGDPEEGPRSAAATAGIKSATGISEREGRILHNLLAGHSNKVIARELDISEATVKLHMKAVLRKLNVRNRTQAALWAAANGFLKRA